MEKLHRNQWQLLAERNVLNACPFSNRIHSPLKETFKTSLTTSTHFWSENNLKARLSGLYPSYTLLYFSSYILLKYAVSFLGQHWAEHTEQQHILVVKTFPRKSTNSKASATVLPVMTQASGSIHRTLCFSSGIVPTMSWYIYIYCHISSRKPIRC